MLWWLFGMFSTPVWRARFSCVFGIAPRRGRRQGGRRQFLAAGSRVELRGSQTHRGNGGYRAIRGACFFGYFLCAAQGCANVAERRDALLSDHEQRKYLACGARTAP